MMGPDVTATSCEPSTFITMSDQVLSQVQPSAAV